MKHVKALTYIISSILTVFGGIGLTMATTWINPTATPPNNGDIDVLSAGGYDGLGDHQARMDLNLTGHRLYGVNNHSTDRALTATSSNSTIVALITASNNFGTEVQSQANDQPAVLARNLGTGYALMASSTRGWAAQFGQALQLATSSIGIPARVQWGTGSTNYLSTASAGSAAAGSLYWGMMPLCDMGQADCGRVKASLGDNLGDHTAQFNLNMMQHSLINLQNKIGTVLATSSLQLTHVGVGASNFGPGLSAVSQNVNGIVAINTIAAPAVAASGYNSGTGYGVTGQSIFGPGISLYGRLKLLTEAASTTLPQLTFGKPVHNASLALTPISAADQNLYWGDKLLCDSSKTNCGWSATAGTPSLWSLIGGNLFTDYLVSIGGVGDSAKLEVVTPSDISLSTQNSSLGERGGDTNDVFSAGCHMTDVENGQLYILTRQSIQIYNISNRLNPVLSKSINLGPDTFDCSDASIEVIGNYAYIPHDGNLLTINTSLANPPVTTFFLGDASFAARRVAVSGAYAYVLGGKLATVNISNPDSPTLSSVKDLGSRRNDIAVSGDYLYIADGTSGLVVMDISSPGTPFGPIVSGGGCPGGAFSADAITIKGHTAYLLCNVLIPSTQRLSSIDISDPNTPSNLDTLDLGEFTTGNQVRSLSVSGRYAYIVKSEGDSGNGSLYELSIVDINNPATMALVTQRDFGDYNFISLTMYAGYGYVYNNDVSGAGNDHLFTFGQVQSADFQNLSLGFTQADSLIVSGDVVNNGNIYLRSGLSVRGDVTLSSGTLNSGVGIINIGGVKLDRGLLQTLITWSNQP